jgi:thiamine-phosphate pyrophosphorylase
MSESRDQRSALRIIDANLNRAREALRVMEEYARFVLDDAAITGAIKNLRHQLVQSVPTSIESELARRRDIVGDTGRDIKTDAELNRSDMHVVVVAAGKRLSEALRAIEEYGKTIEPVFAAAIERLRYEGYEIERRLVFIWDARRRFGQVRLYVIVTEALCHGGWYETAVAALDGGADCLQLREKGLADRELLHRAQRLAGLCRDRGRLFIVNDRPDIAAASGADGVHLGQDDLPISAARRMLPMSAIVGISTHTVEQFDQAVAESPDYIAVGPMFATETKPQDHIAGCSTLSEARRRTSLPLVAIGGIDESNAAEVLRAAACALCVCRGVLARPDVADACRRFRSLADQVRVASTSSLS